MTMALLMVLAADTDRMRRQSSATARMESLMAMVVAADGNGRKEMIQTSISCGDAEGRMR